MDDEIKDKDELYGIPPLNQRLEFLINCIGIGKEDLLYDELSKIYQDKDKEKNIKKGWNRAIKKEGDFSYFCKENENGPLKIIEQILKDLINQYGLDISFCSLLKNCFQLEERFISIECPSNLNRSIIIKGFIIYNIKSLIDTYIDKDINYFDVYVSENFTYDSLFTQLKSELNCVDWTTFYENISESISSETIKKQVEKARNKNEKIKYSLLKQILKLYESTSEKGKSIISQLLNKYCIDNFKLALSKVYNIEDIEIKRMVDAGKELVEAFKKQDKETQENILSRFQKPFDVETSDLINEMGYCAVQNFYNAGDINNALQILQIIEEEYIKVEPSISSFILFFDNYIKGKIYVCYSDFDKKLLKEADNYYWKAFKKKDLAGGLLPQFLKEAFALHLFITNNWYRSVNVSNTNNNTKTIFDKTGNAYWNYGHYLDYFVEPLENAIHEIYNCNSNFFEAFPIDSFMNQNLAAEIRQRTVYEEIGVFSSKKEDNDDKIKQFFEESQKIPDNPNKLNKNIKHPLVDTNSDCKEIYYLPRFALLFNFSLYNSDYLDIAEKWLKEYKHLDLNNVTSKNETIISFILKQYKYIRTSGLENASQLEPRFKNIILSIIDNDHFQKENLLIKSNYNQECALSLALDCFDYDVVKAIIDKVDISDYRVSILNLTPIDYIDKRIKYLPLKIKEFFALLPKELLETKEIADSFLKNSPLPGFTLKDKCNAFDKFIESLFNNDVGMKNIYLQIFGNPDTSDIQIEKLKEIRTLFI